MSMAVRESRFTGHPPLLALFHKRIDGDDALLQLARLRFEQAGLGIECYAETPGELEWLLGFRPNNGTPATVHLSRSIDLFEKGDRERVANFARRFQGRLYGLVVHDQKAVADRFEEYVGAVREMESFLSRIRGAPYLFLEYAAGLDPELFVRLFEALADCVCVSACIDTGHLGLRRVREVFARTHPGGDVCRVTPSDPQLPEFIEEVQKAVGAALEQVVQVVRELSSLGKPLHFHLHDGHPLWVLSPFGVSDHLSFLTRVPIPFDYRGRKSLRTMFGPSGLCEIIAEPLKFLSPDRVSFSLEIHPTEGRVPLGDASYLFRHWTDRQNAEMMNFWLSVLAQNHLLVAEMCQRKLRDQI